MAQPKRSWNQNASRILAAGVGVSLSYVYRDRIRRAHTLPRPDPAALIIEPARDQDGAIPLQGGINFRDVGGYAAGEQRVKYGLLYRSGGLHALTDSDLRVLESLQVKQIFDLRMDQEIAHLPDRVPDGAAYHHVEVSPSSGPARQVVNLMRNADRVDELMVLTYTQALMDGGARAYAGIFASIADAPDGSAVIHCTAGKDRTGMGVALLLSALGVPDETIVADYTLSNRAFALYYPDAAAQMAPLRRFGLSVDDLTGMLVCNPDYMRRSLAHLRQHYGTAESYLLRAGLTDDQLARLRGRFLEPA